MSEVTKRIIASGGQECPPSVAVSVAQNAAAREDECRPNITNLLSGKGTAIPLFKVFMPESVMEPLRETLFSGYIGEGPRAREFERRLAPWLGRDHVLTTNSGTSAIQLALRLAGVGPGDEVVTTPMTCVATNVPILALGARVVWADIDPWSGAIDPQDVARKITPRTRAILAVHWGGYPCDMDRLAAIAAAHGLCVIQDACHAFGATFQGRPVGATSDFACFSFQAIKPITTVDGGALTCARAADYERGRLLRWYGIDRENTTRELRCDGDIAEYGYKFHMNDVAAVIGMEQLKYIAGHIVTARAQAARYDKAFAPLKNVRPLRYQRDRASACWLYTLRVRDRARFIQAMDAARIAVSRVHGRNDVYSMFAESRTALPGVDEFAAEHICIPIGWWLSEHDVEHIIKSVVEFDR